VETGTVVAKYGLTLEALHGARASEGCTPATAAGTAAPAPAKVDKDAVY